MYKDPLDPRARAARRKHYAANREQYYARNKAKIEQILAIIVDAKNKPCMDCGKKYPSYVMDLDHRDPLTKVCDPAKLARRGSISKTLEEIAKCDVVCSNCHRERTYGSKAGEAMAAEKIPNLL